MMKRTGLHIIMLMLMMLPMWVVTSCDSAIEDENLVIIEPEDLPMFQFDENGTPYRWHTPMLSATIQRDMQKEFVGYGWKWMQTNEIMENGHVCPKEYYEDMIGMSPSSYYVESDKKLVSFFYSDAKNKLVYKSYDCQMDTKTGMVTTGIFSSAGYPWSIYMRVWSIYELSGKWYMSCVEPLAIKTTDFGNTIVWGTSQYVRMTDAELQDMQKKHNFN